MDTVVNVLTSLGANSSFYSQFVIFLVLFALSKFLFLDLLQTVLETRESKSSKVGDEADLVIKEAETVIITYSNRLKNEKQNSSKQFALKKEEINKKNYDVIKNKERELTEYLKGKSSEIEAEFQKLSRMIEEETSGLSNQLAEKFKK